MAYPKIDFLYLSEPDMIEAGVTNTVECTDTMEEVLKLLNKGDIAWEAKTVTPMAAWYSSLMIQSMLNFPICQRMDQTAALCVCLLILVASLIWQALSGTALMSKIVKKVSLVLF